jgi:hypothetical protein
VGEQVRVLADRGAPGDLAAVALLGLLGDGDPLGAGVLAPAGDPALGSGGRGLAFTAVHGRQLTDDDDLLAVDAHARRPDEPVRGQPPGEPVRRVVRRRQVGLLPAARPAEWAASATTAAAEAGTEARAEPRTEGLGERTTGSERAGTEARAERPTGAATPAATSAAALLALLAELAATMLAVVLVVFVMTVARAVLWAWRVLRCGVHG